MVSYSPGSDSYCTPGIFFKKNNFPEICNFIIVSNNDEKIYKFRCKSLHSLGPRGMWLHCLVRGICFQFFGPRVFMVFRIRQWSQAPGVVLPYSLGRGVPLGSRKSYPLRDQIVLIL